MAINDGNGDERWMEDSANPIKYRLRLTLFAAEAKKGKLMDPHTVARF